MKINNVPDSFQPNVPMERGKIGPLHFCYQSNVPIERGNTDAPPFLPINKPLNSGAYSIPFIEL